MKKALLTIIGVLLLTPYMCMAQEHGNEDSGVSITIPYGYDKTYINILPKEGIDLVPGVLLFQHDFYPFNLDFRNCHINGYSSESKKLYINGLWAFDFSQAEVTYFTFVG